MSQVKQYFEAYPRGRSSVRIGNQWLVNVAVYIKLNIQFLVYHIIYIGPQLEIDVSIGYGIHFFNFSLNGSIVCNAHIEPESDVILDGRYSSLVLPW